MKVYQLFKATQYKGVWYPMGTSYGEVYLKLERAQAQVVGNGPWTKRERRRAWETPRGDFILERKVHS